MNLSVFLEFKTIHGNICERSHSNTTSLLSKTARTGYSMFVKRARGFHGRDLRPHSQRENYMGREIFAALFVRNLWLRN